MDPVKILPTEVIEQIFSHLNLKDLMACGLVSQKWNIAANNETLWKEFCAQNGWSDCGSFKKQLNCFNFLNTDPLKDAFSSMGEWKKHFVIRSQLQNNWRTGNSVDHTIQLPKTIDENDVGMITSISSDGLNVVAFGFAYGLMSLFELKNNGSNELKNRNYCLLLKSADFIKIVDKYLILLQENLLQLYVLGDSCDLELYRAKQINTSSITNFDLSTLMQLSAYARTDLVMQSKERSDDKVLFHFSTSHLVVTTCFSHKIYVYYVSSDFMEPNIILSVEDLGIDITNKFIFNIHCNHNVLYILLCVDTHKEVCDTSKYSIHAFSLKTKSRVFSSSLVDEDIAKSNFGTIATNDHFIVLRFQENVFFLYDKAGQLLLNDKGMVFLNVNSDPSLVGLCTDISFEIMDPTIGSHVFCLTLEGSPAAMFSNVLITSCVEYDCNGIGSTEIEFLKVFSTVQKIGSLEFPKNHDVTVIYKDDTKVILNKDRDSVVVRSFLV